MTAAIAITKEHGGSERIARGERGFSLLELTIAMAIFLIISGVAFTLFNQQQTSTKRLQGQTGLNIALRNAVAELQMDLAGAGSGYFQGVNMPSWPIAVTIVNNMNTSGASCYNSSSKTYGIACFDQLNIIAAPTVNSTCTPGSCYPPINATDSTGGSGTGNCSNTYNSSGTANAYGRAAVVNGTTWTLANTAAEFKSGDQLLFMNNAGTLVTSVVLTANAAVSGSAVKFTFKSTNTDGSNILANDPLDITACDGTYGTNLGCASHNTIIGNPPQFCGSDYILKLAPVQYLVCSGPGSNSTWCDQSSTSPDIQNPKLVRIQNATKSVVMEQVIGFRAGAALWNGASETADNDTVTTSYNYLASTYQYGNGTSSVASPWNFSLIRSVRVSLIGRTAPSNTDIEFKNAFDQGPYQVQGIAVVVNPRNASMNDN